MKIVIDPEFQALIPPLRSTEKELLEVSIIRDGCLQPLVLWGNVLIDGHNRYEICCTHELDFNVERMEFEDRDAAKWWILTNQIGRRNLTLVQSSYLRGRYWDTAKDAKLPFFNRKGGEKALPEKFSHRQQMVAETFGVSSSTIRSDYTLFKSIEQLGCAAKAFVLSGEHILRKQHIMDLSALAEDTQERLIDKIQSSEIKNLSSAIHALKGRTTAKSSHIKCPTCGVRLGCGVTTCLKCDIGDKAVCKALTDTHDRDELGVPIDFEARLNRVRESKLAEQGDPVDAIKFHAGKTVRLLNSERKPQLDKEAVKALIVLARRIRAVVDLDAPRPTLRGMTAHELNKRQHSDAGQ